jgi:outer membrane protein OmpA-like peptidoglycan-associated protein
VSKGKLLAACVVWLLIAIVLAVAYKLIVTRKDRDYRAEVYSSTSSSSQYQHNVTLALDSFSGYAVLRSPEFKTLLGQKRIRVNLLDDGANYSERVEALRRGDTDLAVFTIDALLKVCASLNELPGSIVAIIDETRGADAIVAYKSAIPNVDAMNAANTRMVLTPDSPSETLARVVMMHFSLDNLDQRPFIEATDAEDVYKRYRAAKPDEPLAFVLWEPFVSKVLENPNTHVVVDSSRFRGYIVDVLVANRDYLHKNPDVVRDVVGCYFRAAYSYRDKMVDLVLADARETGAPLNDKQAANLVNGIWWKNTQENFAHFGMQQNQPVQLLEDMIANLNRVLLGTQAMDRDPTNGKPTDLYYDGVLRELQTSNFHPALDQETVRDDRVELPALSDAEWQKLVPIGTLQVPQLVFARGTARLTGRSTAILDELIQTLNTSPQYYLEIRGNASRVGDLEANTELAKQRAAAAQAYLVEAGVSSPRMRAVAGEPSGATSVSFVLGQPPY